MDLSIGRLAASNNSPPFPSREMRGRESPPVMGSAETSTSPTAEESETQRPVQETSQLTQKEQAQVRELQQRDREVRAHEAAHRAAAGGMVSGGSYSYQTGPDGKNYAVAGEVSISGSHAGSPQEQLRQAETIRRAALAPADPSPQDRMVAAQASAIAFQARAEIRAEQRQEMGDQNKPKASTQDSNSITLGGASFQNRRAIAAFSSVGGGASLHSEPSTIDEII
jgi:hypothetical protein